MITIKIRIRTRNSVQVLESLSDRAVETGGEISGLKKICDERKRH